MHLTVDALDSAEFSGSLIILLNEGVSFVKRNMKTRWKKTADSRVEMPDYCERSVFEALVNALILSLIHIFVAVALVGGKSAVHEVRSVGNVDAVRLNGQRRRIGLQLDAGK